MPTEVGTATLSPEGHWGQHTLSKGILHDIFDSNPFKNILFKEIY